MLRCQCPESLAYVCAKPAGCASWAHADDIVNEAFWHGLLPFFFSSVLSLSRLCVKCQPVPCFLHSQDDHAHLRTAELCLRSIAVDFLCLPGTPRACGQKQDVVPGFWYCLLHFPAPK